MFKELDVWMEELETEIYDAYMRAYRALNAWKTALRSTDKCNDAWQMRNSLKGNYRGYCCLRFSNNYREEVFSSNGYSWVALIDTVVVDGKGYERVLAVTTQKDTDEKAPWGIQRTAEEKFKKQLDLDTGFTRYLQDKRAYPSDVALITDRDAEWIAVRAHKDMLKHKKAIEDKIAKICVAIDTICDDYGEYFVKGTNGRVAHLWRIMAGGYNIQKLHTRVLCKEVKK